MKAGDILLVNDCALSGDPLPPLSFLGRVLDRVRALAFALSPFTKGIR